jgi:hypothetical protein
MNRRWQYHSTRLCGRFSTAATEKCQRTSNNSSMPSSNFSCWKGVQVMKSRRDSRIDTARMPTVGRRCSDQPKRFAEATRSFGRQDVPEDHVDMKSLRPSRQFAKTIRTLRCGQSGRPCRFHRKQETVAFVGIAMPTASMVSPRIGYVDAQQPAPKSKWGKCKLTIRSSQSHG